MHMTEKQTADEIEEELAAWKGRPEDFAGAVRRNRPDLYVEILRLTEGLDKFRPKPLRSGKRLNVSFFERIHCVRHGLKDRPRCRTCGVNYVCEFDRAKDEYKKWCCPKCQASDPECVKKSKKTRLLKYGDENFNNIERSRLTRFMENYGGWHAEDFDDKVKKSKAERHGDPNWNNPEKHGKTVAEIVENDPGYWKRRDEKIRIGKMRNGHGPTWNNREKFRRTLAEFSDEKRKSIVEKRRGTCLERYGVDHVQKDPDIHRKTEKTCMSKYGHMPFQTEDGFRKLVEGRRAASWKIIQSFTDFEPAFTEEEFTRNRDPKRYWTWKCLKCGNVFRSRYRGRILICRKCVPPKTDFKSREETYFREFLMSVGENHDFIFNDRTAIWPMELDAVDRMTNTAFEFDGLYWHSEKQKRDPAYHLAKTEKCEKNGIRLVHVFEDEWLHRRTAVENTVRNMLMPKPEPDARPEIRLIQDQAYAERFLAKTSLMEFSFTQDDVVFETVFGQGISGMIQFRRHADDVWTVENFGFTGGLDFKSAMKPAVE